MMKFSSKNDKTDIKLQKNTKVSLDMRVLDEQGNQSTLSVSSFVEKVNSDSSFLIKMPMCQDIDYPFTHDTPYRMFFTAEPEKSMNPKIFAVPVRFIGTIKMGSFVYAKMKPMGDITQCQRRDCYRLPISMPVSLKQTDGASDRFAPPLTARVVDFSDGGMLFSTYKNLNVGETLILDFTTGRHETVEGVVRRTEPVDCEKREFKVAVKFTSADPTQRRRFYQFILKKQYEKRQRAGQGNTFTNIKA